MNISSLMNLFTPVDVNDSDCHRKLTTMGQCARFYLAAQTSTVCKVVMIAAAVIGVTFVAGSLVGLGALTAKVILTYSPHVLVTIIGVSSIAASIFFARTKIQVMYQQWKSEFYRECQVLKQEEQIVEALGGQAVYDRLPKLSAQAVNDIHLHDRSKFKRPNQDDVNNGIYEGYLDEIQPRHVNHQKITVGVDACNRPFIAVCVQEKNQPRAALFVQTFFQRHNPAHPDSWLSAGHDGKVFVQREFDENLEILRQLQDGTHPTHEFV